jgi:translation elongation factor EF-Tu-like GTPase
VDAKDRAHWERRERDQGFLRVRVRLLTTEEGGRQSPIFDGYRAAWDIGNLSESGEWTTKDAPLLFENRDSLPLGETAEARIHPIAPELWTDVSAGAQIAMHEGLRVVGRAEVLEVVGPTADRR